MKIGFPKLTTDFHGFRKKRFEGSMTFTEEELLRYNRQMMIPEIGEEGQKKIKEAKVCMDCSKEFLEFHIRELIFNRLNNIIFIKKGNYCFTIFLCHRIYNINYL